MSDKIIRRDLLEACKIAGVPMQKLETDPTAQLALAYLADKRSGATDVDFDSWLDEELDIEVTESESGDSDPS